jgi:alpha-L-fucosidase 2
MSNRLMARRDSPRLRSTMKRILRDQDLVYERAPLEWVDGIPLANGSIGAMIWGDGSPLHFTLDSYDVWETRTMWPGDDPKFTFANLRRLKEEGRLDEFEDVALRIRRMRFTDNPPPYPSRLSLGRMELGWPEPPKEFAARLDLARARATTTLTLARGRATVSAFVASTRDVLVVEIRCPQGVPLPEIKLSPAAVDDESRKLFRSWNYPDLEIREEPGRHILFRRYSVGKEYSIVAEEARSGRSLTVFLTIAAGKEGDRTEDRTLRRLAEARKAGVPALRAEHEEDWEKFWEKSAIQLPDSRLENLYYAELYKHYCSSRPGHLPVTLQGLWTTDGSWPPWRGTYTADMNVEESYWPIYASNHLESGEPLYEMYWRNLPYHRKIGAYWYGKKIAIVTGEHGPGGEIFPMGLFPDTHSPSNGAWIAHSFWCHWLYSQDKKFLRERAYPFLKEMVQGYLHIIEKRADGKYHIPFCDSPEFFCGQADSLGDDNNLDIALLRFLLESLLDSQKHLRARDPDCARWEEVLRDLIPYATAPSGLFEYGCLGLGRKDPKPDTRNEMCLSLRAGLPLPHTHRHHAHLMAIYPLGTIDPERSDEERRLVEKSLEDLIYKGTGEWAGWSFPWASLMASRAGKPRMANHFLQTYMEGFIRPNTFHNNGSEPADPNGIIAGQGTAMTLEGGFAAAAAILEMLLQSQHGLIRLFPTCPPMWQDIQFVNLRAEGAFLVSARKRDGCVLSVEIASEAGGLCRVRNPFSAPCELTDLDSRRSRAVKGDILEFPTKRGGRYRLTDGRKLSERDLALTPAVRPARERNWFGVKRCPKF